MVKMKWLASLGTVLIVTGCAAPSEPDEYDVESYDAISNPASVFCAQQQGELRAFDENNQRVMYCVLSEDERVEQWQYYNENRHKMDKK
jgi:putative hemolysin